MEKVFKPGVYSYTTQGTCSRAIHFEIDNDGRVVSVSFDGGCPGNTHELAELCNGRRAADLIERLGGIDCRNRSTSCPDHQAKALA